MDFPLVIDSWRRGGQYWITKLDLLVIILVNISVLAMC